MGTPRNNFTRLSYWGRQRVMEMLLNGATHAQIQQDDLVAKELMEKKLTLHSTTFLAIHRSKEYQDFIVQYRASTSPLWPELLRLFKPLSHAEKLRCIEMVAANFGDKIPERN